MMGLMAMLRKNNITKNKKINKKGENILTRQIALYITSSIIFQF